MAALSHNLSKLDRRFCRFSSRSRATETEVRKYRVVVVTRIAFESGKNCHLPGLVQAQAAADDIEKHLKEGSVGDLNEAFQDMNAALKG